MYDKTFQQYKELIYTMAENGVATAILDKEKDEKELMNTFAYEHIWNALQYGYKVPLKVLDSVDKDILNHLNISINGDKIRYKDAHTGEWMEI